MALANYEDLRSSILAWSHRDDIDELLNDFIALAEVEMFSNSTEVLQLRVMEKLTTQAALLSTRINPLPSDFLQQRRLRLDIGSGDNGELTFKAPEQMIIQSASGRPRFFTITDSLEFDRVPDSAYTIEFQYYQKPTALSSTNATNVIMTNHPTIYLYGALHQVFLYAVDEIEAVKWEAKFFDAIKGANKKDKKGRFGPAPSMRVEGVTP